MKEIDSYEKRLNEMIASDIKENTFRDDKLIKSEIINVLKNYFILSNDDVEITIEPINAGRYVLNIDATLRGVKKLKKII